MEDFDLEIEGFPRPILASDTTVTPAFRVGWNAAIEQAHTAVMMAMIEEGEEGLDEDFDMPTRRRIVH